MELIEYGGALMTEADYQSIRHSCKVNRLQQVIAKSSMLLLMVEAIARQKGIVLG